MSDAGTGPEHSPGRVGGRRRTVPAFAAGALAGTLVGGLAVGLVAAAGDEPPPPPVASPPASPTPTPTSSGLAVTVVVPPACLAAVERAQVTTDLVREGIEAARRLDTARLQQISEELQARSPELAGLAQECRAATGSSLSTPVPTPATG